MPKEVIYPSRLPEVGDRTPFPKIEVAWESGHVWLRMILFTEANERLVIEETPLSLKGLSQLIRAAKRARRQAFLDA